MANVYDQEHDAKRLAWAPDVATGTVVCRRAPFGLCLEDDPLIAPDAPWDLGHPDAECAAPRAPEHRRCNRSTAPRRWAAARRRPEVHPALRDIGDLSE